MALPKCPACVAGYLSVLGIGLGAGTTIAGVMRPTFIVLALLTAGWTIARIVRRPRVAIVRG